MTTEPLRSMSRTEALGLKNPRTMFESQAFDPTGLKRESQLKDWDLPLKVGEAFVYFGKWVVLLQTIGKFNVVYDIDNDNFFIAPIAGVDDRCIGSPRQISGIDIEKLQDRYKSSLKVYRAENSLRVRVDDTKYNLDESDLDSINLQLVVGQGSNEKRMETQARKIKFGTFNDVRIGEDGSVEEHVIIAGNENSPTIVVGDWHQAIIAELPILRALNLIPRNLPVQIDWLDEHTDEYFYDFQALGGVRRLMEGEFESRKSLLEYPKTVKQALQKIKKIHCGRAAFALSGEVTHLTHPSIFQGEKPSKWIDVFSTVNPFDRKSGQPHVLSLDCDFFGLASSSYKDEFLEHLNFEEVFRYFIDEKGFKLKNYDAIMIYTSPGFCSARIAKKVIDFIGNLHENLDD